MASLSVSRILYTGTTKCQSQKEVAMMTREVVASVKDIATNKAKSMPTSMSVYTFHTTETGECMVSATGTLKNRQAKGEMEALAKKTTRQTQMKMRMRAKLIAKGVIPETFSVTYNGTSWA